MGCGSSTASTDSPDSNSGGRITAELKRKLGVQRTATYLATDPNSLEEYKRVLRSAGAPSSDDEDDHAPIVVRETGSDRVSATSSSTSSALRKRYHHGSTSSSDMANFLNRSSEASRRVSIRDPDVSSNRSLNGGGGSFGLDALGRNASSSSFSLNRASSMALRSSSAVPMAPPDEVASFGFEDDPSMPHVPWSDDPAP